MTNTAESVSLKTTRPSVYLDQWVWVRLASAAIGEPREPSDPHVLAAVRQASQAGVVFPLSATHYHETARITHPRQRTDLARTMASISHCRSLCSGRILLRHQFLEAMHLSFGRPAFKPTPPQPLGIGVGWAFAGKRLMPQLRGPSGPVDPASMPGMSDVLHKAAQFTEYQLLAGPQDADLPDLRRRGYRPEEVHKVNQNRLGWETFFADLLAGDPVSRAELRVRVQAREIIHEHYELLRDLFAEYRLDLLRATGADPARPKASRSRMVAFADRIPSVRIAVDVKVELFRNAARTWNLNTVHDIDAVSLAVPYCHVVVPDREIADLMDRSKAGPRNGTHVLRGLRDLPDVLADLTTRARTSSGGLGSDGWVRDDEEFCMDLADLAALAAAQASGQDGS
ncbi:hypothetical protein HZZ00_18755 [Streptomyces sp. NEAU-sy36]|uniref:hypothetical protein n=1 Tax=unclassified Streptomyces TaxID=2593676 RepID=UPI0015D604CF|nr:MULTISPECIES: hypothetical protein [unclassified Streptomyces]QLJ02848.1 hypothetical protein HZZ00_18755 [Streptomyces sp. NEAU-sy36]